MLLRVQGVKRKSKKLLFLDPTFRRFWNELNLIPIGLYSEKRLSAILSSPFSCGFYPLSFSHGPNRQATGRQAAKPSHEAGTRSGTETATPPSKGRQESQSRATKADASKTRHENEPTHQLQAGKRQNRATKQVQARNGTEPAKAQSTGRKATKENHEADTSTKPQKRSQNKKYREKTAKNEPRSRYKHQTAETEPKRKVQRKDRHKFQTLSQTLSKTLSQTLSQTLFQPLRLSLRLSQTLFHTAGSLPRSGTAPCKPSAVAGALAWIWCRSSGPLPPALQGPSSCASSHRWHCSSCWTSVWSRGSLWPTARLMWTSRIYIAP